MNEIQQQLRKLPAVDQVLGDDSLQSLAEDLPHVLLREAAQQAVDSLRHEILNSEEPMDASMLETGAVAQRAVKLALSSARPSLRHVINATGTLLHTNLGRAPLSDDALAAIDSVARSYSNLEIDLEPGERGHRFAHVEKLLCRLTGAEAATVVNNNAGAVLLSLTALAKGREAIVSRGELVEIGGAFRVPDVMEAGGVTLREVGTTNKTHLKDYRGAITEETGLLLKVHTSNYRIVGFTAAVDGSDLAKLGREQGIPVMEDLGSGMLIDLSPFGLPKEPTVAEAVASDLDVVTFSGDKLLGGPQAGLIVGKRWALDKIRQHPMARAMRIDKLTLAALEATLRHYLDREKAVQEIPVLRMLAAEPDELKSRSRSLCRRLSSRVANKAQVSVMAGHGTVGGGALPLTELPGPVVAVVPEEISVDLLARRLRTGENPVVGRIQEGRLLLDPRTINKTEEPLLIEAMAAALKGEV